MRHRVDPEFLVQMGTAEEDEHAGSAGIDAAHAPGVTRYRGWREMRQVGDGGVPGRRAEEIGCRHPSRAEDDSHVVLRLTAEFGDGPRGVSGALSGKDRARMLGHPMTITTIQRRCGACEPLRLSSRTGSGRP